MGWILAGAAAAVAALAFLGRPAPAAPGYGLWQAEWRRRAPREYDSWRSTRAPGRTKWGGARELPGALFAGLAFASADGPSPPGHPVACGTCHDPASLGLRPSQPAFLAALKEQGTDPAAHLQQAAATQVCAQCHSARLQGWEQGPARSPLRAEELLALADRPGPTDWIHAGSGTPLVRVRHAEYELWALGPHAHRGVTCVDCHMPAEREGTQRLTRHRLESPLLDVTASCSPCHPGGEVELRARAEALQDTTMALQRRAAEALQAAHAALGEARRAGIEEPRLEPARLRLRQAQARWDLVASEGSTGFHAPQAAAGFLGTALDLARQAQLDAERLRTRTAP